MPRSRIDVEGEIDRVYGRPLAQFMEARKALAARLAAEGFAKDAARVKDLKKPSATAWAVNQLRFAAPEVLESLLEAGDRLRGKSGDRQDAMQARRAALASARRKIEEILNSGGRAATPDLQRRISATLEAIVVYGHAPGSPAVGRLTEDLAAPGFDEIASLGLLGPRVPRLHLVPKSRPPAPPRPDPARERALEEKLAMKRAAEARKVLETRVRETKRARAKLAAAEKALEAARQRQQELETALSSAMRLERKLREEVAAARKALEGAEAAEVATGSSAGRKE